MSANRSSALEDVMWDDIKQHVANINRPLYDIIERISPTKPMRFLKVKYHYGDMIVDNGIFQIPNAAGQLVPLHDASIPTSLAKSLTYSAIPLGLLLGRAIEIFVDTKPEIIPLNSMSKGRLFGVFELLDAFGGEYLKPHWSVCAGVRSSFLLPKISERTRHLKLARRFHISNSTPKSLSDHATIFYGISNCAEVREQWQCEILFFTSEWFDYPGDDPSWLSFQNFLYRNSWQQAQFARDYISLGLLWKKFATVLAQRSLKPRPYLADTVKNIVAIAKGGAPAFIPADDSEDALPSKWIQNAYTEIYGLKEYLPTIMHLSNLTYPQVSCGYYSLSHPILLAGAESGRTATAIMTDIRDLKLLLETLLGAIASDDITSNIDLLHKVNFDYFHTERDNFRDILPGHVLFEEDKQFMVGAESYPGRSFCASSAFLRGCVRISKKDTPITSG